MDITEGNKLIAEFMGFYLREDSPYYHSGNKNNETEHRGMHKDALHYHTSWDWLMPVVEKIEKIHDDHHGYFGVHISSNSCSIQGTNLWKAIKENSNYGAVYMSDPNAILNTKIESTWYNVIQFIQWYNQQTKK